MAKLGSNGTRVNQASIIEEQAARIKELEADLAQSEICIRARMDVIDDQAARIKELEKNCIYDPDGHPEVEKLRARITCGSCMWFRNRRATACRDQENPEHACDMGLFRPLKIALKPRGGRGGA